MPDVECSDCGGSGTVIGRDGNKVTCMNCGGAGFYAVEESEMTEEMRERVIQ